MWHATNVARLVPLVDGPNDPSKAELATDIRETVADPDVLVAVATRRIVLGLQRIISSISAVNAGHRLRRGPSEDLRALPVVRCHHQLPAGALPRARRRLRAPRHGLRCRATSSRTFWSAISSTTPRGTRSRRGTCRPPRWSPVGIGSGTISGRWSTRSSRAFLICPPISTRRPPTCCASSSRVRSTRRRSMRRCCRWPQSRSPAISPSSSSALPAMCRRPRPTRSRIWQEGSAQDRRVCSCITSVPSSIAAGGPTTGGGAVSTV